MKLCINFQVCTCNKSALGLAALSKLFTVRYLQPVFEPLETTWCRFSDVLIFIHRMRFWLSISWSAFDKLVFDEVPQLCSQFKGLSFKYWKIGLNGQQINENYDHCRLSLQCIYQRKIPLHKLDGFWNPETTFYNISLLTISKFILFLLHKITIHFH